MQISSWQVKLLICSTLHSGSALLFSVLECLYGTIIGTFKIGFALFAGMLSL